MRLKRYLWLLLLPIAISITVLPTYSQEILQHHQGFQVSTLGALSAGVYEGATNFASVKQQGDFGLGTVEGLDGELVVLDGKFYQIKSDGHVYPVRDEMQTPFVTVTFFRRERTLPIRKQLTYQELGQEIDQQLPTKNLPSAIRIQGDFPYLKVRSVPKQSQPYRPLSEVLNQQQITFELHNVQGTLVGFRLPQYFKSINSPDYHLHFITSDRKAGGHLVEGEFLNPKVEVETLRDWKIVLPGNTAFAQAALE